MAHELEIDRAGRASFCYNAARGNPWHRLGHAFDKPPSLAEALEASRADRMAELAPCVYMTPSGPVNDPTRRGVIWPSVDDPDVWVALGNVNADYPIIQYADVAEIAMAVIGASRHECVLDTMGLLFDGKRFFGFIDFGDVELVLPSGAVDRFSKGLGFMSSHDASQAVTFALSRLRWVCNNTVQAGLYSANAVVRIRHAGDVDDRLRQVPELLGLARGGDDEFEAIVRQLDATAGGHDVLDKVISRLWPRPDTAQTNQRALHNWSDRRDQLHNLFEAPSNLGGFGPTGWAVFNTVTEFLDHCDKRTPGSRAIDAITPSSGATDLRSQALDVLVGASRS